MKTSLISIIAGEKLDISGDNYLENIVSNVIPSVDSIIKTRKGIYKVSKIVYDYSQIGYDNEEHDGAVFIFCFVEIVNGV
jgi:hypothetical protein